MLVKVIELSLHVYELYFNRLSCYLQLCSQLRSFIRSLVLSNQLALYFIKIGVITFDYSHTPQRHGEYMYACLVNRSSFVSFGENLVNLKTIILIKYSGHWMLVNEPD